MDTNNAPVKEVFEELFSMIETLQSETAAVLQFLKDQGTGTLTDEQLAPDLERAGASDVKLRAARARMEYLFNPIKKAPEESSVKQQAEHPGSDQKPEEPKDQKQADGAKGQTETEEPKERTTEVASEKEDAETKASATEHADRQKNHGERAEREKTDAQKNGESKTGSAAPAQAAEKPKKAGG